VPGAHPPQIYHPNVDLEGNVCLNILREDWKPVLNLNSVMVGLQYLFLEPNADDPLNKGPSRSTLPSDRAAADVPPCVLQRLRRSSARAGSSSSRT
jgi:ubiquitin-protein ligase